MTFQKLVRTVLTRNMWLIALALAGAALLLFAPALYAQERRDAGDSSRSLLPRSPEAALSAVWERARDAGSYAFSADVAQTTIPLATVENVGRGSRTNRLYMEGESAPEAGTMALTLWSDGGSVLDAESGITVRVDGDQVAARLGDSGPWETIDNFGALFAPDGDFMAFLVAARHVEAHAEADGVTRYTFDIDGPRFAVFMRDRMQEQMVAAGELLPNATLAVPPVYREMTGRGTLWAGADGLPLRQDLRLDMPEAASPQEGTRLEVASTVTFSAFQLPVAGAGPSDGAAPRFGAGPALLLDGVAESAAAALPMVVVTVLFGVLLAVLFLRSRSRVVYAAFAVALVAAMVLTPLVQLVHAARADTRLRARAAVEETRREESAMVEAVNEWRSEERRGSVPAGALADIRSDDGTDSDGDGHSDVVESLLGDRETPALAPEEEFSDLFVDEACLAIVDAGYSAADADGDGLSDYEECLLGTSSQTSTLRDGITADGVDSDGDTLSDLWEVTGVEYNGVHWFPDPLEADTNGDTLPDTVEWEVDADGDGQIDDSDGDGIPDMRDTDGDGVPDLFDDDNDGDGVVDRLDRSPFTASAVPLYDGSGVLTGYDGLVFGEDAPLELELDDVAGNVYTFVEFQLRPTNPDHLWYAFNVFDWPQYDRRGQIQDDDNLTFLDVNGQEQASANDGYGDVKLIPMLEIRIPGTNSGLPDAALLRQYGISSKEDVDGTLAYVPLYLVDDDQTREKAAFYAKMIYLPGAGWDAAHEVNLVWMVQMLVDRCESYEYLDDAGETQQSSECQSYGDRNELEVIHVYDNDSWYLTGLNVREDHGARFAIAYEDPAVDTDLEDDAALIRLAQGFDYAFLTGRDCGSGDTCQRDGVRDITVDDIYQRWNRTTNGDVTEDERWGIDNILRVQQYAFDNIDTAVATIAMTTTRALLENSFGAAPTVPVTPTLLFAREEVFRANTLDLLGTSLSWNGNRLNVNMDPALVPLEIMAGINWSAYSYVDDAWTSLSVDSVWDEIGRRYVDAFPTDELEVAEGKLIWVQLFYTSLVMGSNRIVESNGFLTPSTPTLDLPDKTLTESIVGGVGSAADFIAKKLVLAAGGGVTVYKFNSYFKYLRAAFTYKADDASSFKVTDLRDKLSKVTKLSGWKLNVAGGAIVAGAVLVVALLIGLSFALGGDDVGTAVLKGLLSAVVATAILFKPIKELATVLKQADGASKLVKSLGGLTKLSQASKVAGIIGLVISIGIAIGVFIYQWVEDGLSAGSPEFNYLLAFTIATIVLAVLLFVLALTVVGAVIIALLTVVDLILTIFGADFSITTWLTEQLTDHYYTYEQIFESEVDFGSMDMGVDNPELGLVQGATFSYQTEITTTVVMTDPNWQASFYVGTVFFNEDDFDDTTFIYDLNTDVELFTEDEIEAGSSAWINIEADGSYGLFDLFRGDTVNPVDVSGVGVPVGVNQSPSFFLNSGYDMPAYTCWGQGPLAVCYTESMTGTDFVELGDGLYYDILPASVGEFAAFDWAGDYQSFPIPLDHDGDGLTATGLDPDDRNWDVDGDGLSDAAEISLRGRSREDGGFPISYLSADTDADGVCDGAEIRLGTDPADRDTDGDGLTDGEEVWHRDCATGEWRGGWLFTYLVDQGGDDRQLRIFSDPLKADGDGDGFNDRVEKLIHLADPVNFPFHPAVFNDSPGGLYPAISEIDRVLSPGQTVAYTLTVRNNFPDPYWVYGGITVTMPAVLGGGVFNDVTFDPDGAGDAAPVTDSTFNLFPNNIATLVQALQVDPAAGSSIQTITNELRSQLNDNGDISYDWVLDPFSLTRAGTGYIPFDVALAAAPAGTGWGTPYVAAVLEGDDLTDPIEFEVVLYELDDGVADRTVIDDFTMEPDDLLAYGIPTVDVACAADGDCLVVYDSFQTDPNSSGNEGMHVFGAQVAPGGVVAGAGFSIGLLGDTDAAYDNDVRLPAVATDGSRFWLAYAAENYLGGGAELVNGLLARRVNDNGTLGAVSRVDQNDAGLPNTVESDVDLVWMGGDRLIATWTTPDDAYNVIHKALLDASAAPVAGSYEEVTANGDFPQLAYEPSMDRGMLLYRERQPRIDNPNIDELAIRAVFIEAGQMSHGFRPAGDAAPNDDIHSPTVAYDYFNDGWIVAWIGQTGDSATLYWTSYNRADSQARILRQAVPLSGIAPPTGLSAACAPQPPIPGLTDCRVAGAEGWTAGTGDQLFWQRTNLIYDAPFYGAYDNEAFLDLIVDDDAPTSSFVNLPTHARPDEVIIIGGEADDPTSSVARVEISVDGGPFEPAAQGVNAASWVYALDSGGAGLRQLAIRAVDAADNVQVAPTTAGLIVDGAPPQVTLGLADGDVIAPQEVDEGTWTVALSGTVADPSVAGQAGSGVTTLDISVTPAGSSGGNWEPVNRDAGGNWQIDYPLTFASRNREQFGITGPYDVRVRATDALGQRMEQTIATIGIDNRPPVVRLEAVDSVTITETEVIVDDPLQPGTPFSYLATVPGVITGSVPISGTATDAGAAVSGIPSVELSYTPLDFLTSPYAGTTLNTPLWNPATVTPISPTLSTWTETVPAGLEGFFRLEARAADGVGNVEDARPAWSQWSGEIDTNTPRITVDVRYAGWGLTARTEYDLTVEDLNLVEEGFYFDACMPESGELEDGNRGYYTSAWADQFLNETRLAQINVTCFEPGLVADLFNVQSCDAFGRCTGRTFELASNLYVADNSRVLTRTNSVGGGAETAAVLDGMNRPVYTIDNALLTYVSDNDTPAATIRQSRLDGSDDVLLANLRPGTGSAQSASVIPGDLVQEDAYGADVAFSADGSTMVVADGNIYSTGSLFSTAEAYVFERNGGQWMLANTLTSELDGGGSVLPLSGADSVAINEDGSFIVVGSEVYDTSGNNNAGGLIVFERPGASWSDGLGSPVPVARLVASDPTFNGRLGATVRLSGGNVVAGAPNGDAFYVFEEPVGGWTSATENAKVTLPAGGLNLSLDVDDDRIAAAHSNSAYVYLRSGVSWILQSTLSGAAGPGVALSGDTAIAGNDVFTFDGSGWVREATLPLAVDSVALDGDVAVLGDTGSGIAGAARVFVRNQGAWLEHLYLEPGGGESGDDFGAAVAIVGDTVAVGAPAGRPFNTGDLLLYRIGVDGLIHAPDAPESAGGFFGRSVAVDGNLLVMGAPLGRKPGTIDVTGTAAVYRRVANVWYLEQILFANDGQSSDQFGTAVDIDGNTIIVGAPRAQNNGGIPTGAVYFFTHGGGVWTQQDKVVNGRSDQGAFGRTVALSGDTAVVGAPGNRSNEGQVYVYTRSGGWSYAATLISTDAGGGAQERFGHDVDIDGDVIVVAPDGHDTAFVFTRPGSGWTSSVESARLTVGGEALAGVTVSGESAAAIGNSLHIFRRPGGGWTGTVVPTQMLDSDLFYSVDLDADRLVVGSVFAALVYVRDVDGAWSAAAPLTVADASLSDFGRQVAVSGGTIVVGASGYDSSTGAAYAFDSVSVAAVDAGPGVVVWAQETRDGAALFRHDGGASPWQRAALAGPATDRGFLSVTVNDASTALYWTEFDLANDTQGRVMRAGLPGGENVTILVPTGPRPYGVALNETEGKLYWTTDGEGALYQANLDGGGAVQLYNGLTNPGDVALIPSEGALYWVEQGGNAAVLRGDLSGSAPVPVIGLSASVAGIDTDQNRLPVTADQTISTLVNEPVGFTLDGYDPDNDPLTFTILANPAGGTVEGAPPQLTYVPGDDFSGIDSFTFRATDGRGGRAEATVTAYVGTTPPPVLSATGTYTQGTNLVVNVEPLDQYTPNPRDSVILNPADGTVITQSGSLTVSGAAYAFNGLQGLIVWVDDTVIAAIPYNGVITSTNWSTSWTPPGDGVYVLESGAVETGSILEGERTPITITVDTLPPTIDIDTTVISATGQIGSALVEVGGAATDLAAVSRVEFRHTTLSSGFGPWQPAEYDAATGRWRYALPIGNLPEGSAVLGEARAVDRAGNVATTTSALFIDLAPPAAVDLGVTYAGAPLAPGDLVPVSQATVDVSWTGSSDGSGPVDYLVGISNSPDPTDPWLESSTHTSAGQRPFVVDEAQSVYVHLRLEDGYGNRRTQTVGPIHVDGPFTPDLIGDLDYDGWRARSTTLLATDYEIQRGTPPGAALHRLQRLFGSWNGTHLRLAWQGADWRTHGDLFLYLDSAGGGATAAYDPFTPAGPPLTLPDAVGAEYVIHVQDTVTATLLAWNGGGWSVVQALDDTSFRYENGVTDLLLPFSVLGIGDPANSGLALVAVATEENALRTWAAAPEKNPLNSSRVIDPLAAGYVADGYQLTQAIIWPFLGDGILPSGSFGPGSDLHVTVNAAPAGVSAAYLASDWLDLLEPGTPLDADLDGEPDVALPVPAAPLPLGDGDGAVYTVTIRNEGSQAADGVLLALTSHGALALDGPTNIPVGTIPAGGEIAVQVNGTISTGLSGDAAELNGVVTDYRHGPFEWFWVHHPVDRAAPTDIVMTTPVSYVVPFTNTIAGVVTDPGGVPTIDLMIRPIPGNVEGFATCTDPTPYDGAWHCPLNLGSLDGKIAVELRARATDSFGQVGQWSPWRYLPLDRTPPVVLITTDVDLLVQDGFLNLGEATWRGLLSDDFAPDYVEACVAGACTTADAPLGPWQLSLPLPAVDGVTATVAITGTDAAGNVSAPLLREVTVDTVAPTLVVSELVTQTTPTGGGAPLTVVEGTSADGGGVAEIYARLEGPDGTYWSAVQRSGDTWRFAPALGAEGDYAITLQVYDLAGNGRSYGPFNFTVASGTFEIFLPLVVRGQPGAAAPAETGPLPRAVPRPRLDGGGAASAPPPPRSKLLPLEKQDRHVEQPQRQQDAAGERNNAAPAEFH